MSGFQYGNISAGFPVAGAGDGEGASDGAGCADFVSASKSFHDAPEGRRKLHLDALAYAKEHDCSYFDAVVALGVETA